MPLSDRIRKAYDNQGGGGRVAALPARTTVRAVIFPTKKDTDYIEKVDFAKEGKNASIPAWNLRFVVPEGEPSANRNFFARVPRDFEIYKRDGSLMESYLTLQLAKALGYSPDDLDDDSFRKLQDRELLGKSVNLVLDLEDDTRWDEWVEKSDDPEAEREKARKNPLYAKRNVVKFINAPKAVAKAPVSTAPKPQEDVWAAPAADDVWATSATPDPVY